MEQGHIWMLHGSQATIVIWHYCYRKSSPCATFYASSSLIYNPLSQDLLRINPTRSESSTMSLFLCVDCGGSKTSAVIASASGEILGRALGGPSNYAYLGLELFLKAVTQAVSAALQSCTTPPSQTPVPLPPPADGPQFTAAWFGVSGVDSDADIASITPLLSKLLGVPAGPRLAIANDTSLLAAPIRIHADVNYALAVIAGTGSCVVSFREGADGKLEVMGRTGGWGWILGDEGGGFHVGREALRQVVLEADASTLGGAAPVLTLPGSGAKSLHSKVLDHFRVSSASELLAVIHLPDPILTSPVSPDLAPHLIMVREKRLSSLSPLVFSSAFEDNDPLALRVLKTSVACLADQIALLTDAKRGPRAIPPGETILCLGGSLVGIEKYRQLLVDDLAGRGISFRRVEYVADAAASGAVGLALQMASASS